MLYQFWGALGPTSPNLTNPMPFALGDICFSKLFLMASSRENSFSHKEPFTRKLTARSTQENRIVLWWAFTWERTQRVLSWSTSRGNLKESWFVGDDRKSTLMGSSPWRCNSWSSILWRSPQCSFMYVCMYVELPFQNGNYKMDILMYIWTLLAYV